MIKQSWLERRGVSGYRKIHHDLRGLGERCSKQRVARLTRREGLKSQTGDRRRPGSRGGRPAVVVPTHVHQQFDVSALNQASVTDITDIRTQKGWRYLSVILDLSSRQVVGRPMRPRMDRELAIKALMMAVGRRQPDDPFVVHADQRNQFSSHDWQDFLKAHGLVGSMSRRGNCHDNAVAESFFQSLKRERIRRRMHEEARRDVFDYIELFCNACRRHRYIDGLSPVVFEKRYFNRLASG